MKRKQSMYTYIQIKAGVAHFTDIGLKLSEQLCFHDFEENGDFKMLPIQKYNHTCICEVIYLNWDCQLSIY